MIVLSYKIVAIVIGLLLLGSWITFSGSSKHSTLEVHPLPAVPKTSPSTQKVPVATVHIAGEVKQPGVYEIPMGTRILSALNFAGGPTPFADLNRIKLAKKIKDGDTLWVRRIKQTKSLNSPPLSMHSSSSRLSINHASYSELLELPGIGPHTAQSWIIERQKQPFSSIDDLRRVKGIGPRTIQLLSSYISR